VARRQPLSDPLRAWTSYSPLNGLSSVAFSPDGKVLAAAGDGVRLWDVARRQLLGGPLFGRMHLFWSVAFSPDGKLLAPPTMTLRCGCGIWLAASRWVTRSKAIRALCSA